jgi:hypothetical protein
MEIMRHFQCYYCFYFHMQWQTLLTLEGVAYYMYVVNELDKAENVGCHVVNERERTFKLLSFTCVYTRSHLRL